LQLFLVEALYEAWHNLFECWPEQFLD